MVMDNYKYTQGIEKAGRVWGTNGVRRPAKVK
jgi:hypothetical protein